jgi:hypothetical protein
MDLVLQGGALMAQKVPPQKGIEVPPPTIGLDLSRLLHDDTTADVTIRMTPESTGADWCMSEPEQTVLAHRLILQARLRETAGLLGLHRCSIFDLDFGIVPTLALRTMLQYLFCSSAFTKPVFVSAVLS